MRRWRGIVRQSTWPLVPACALALALATGGCGSSKSSATTSATTASTPTSGLTTNGKINYASPPPNAPVQSGVVKIKYHEITIEPDTLKVKVGSTIEWVNEDPVEHNVTSASGPSKFASGNFGEGKTFRIVLTKPGVIHYRCTNHPATMNGAIEVVS